MKSRFSFHLLLRQKVEPKGAHDQSPAGSATTPALRTSTPTDWPALIVDTRAHSLPRASRASFRSPALNCRCGTTRIENGCVRKAIEQAQAVMEGVQYEHR